jgi:hypothetical protein
MLIILLVSLVLVVCGVLLPAPDLTPVAFMQLFEEFQASSWDGWRGVLARLTPLVREFFLVVGRGAGKSRIVALLIILFASRSYARAPGEFIYCGIFAPDRKQAAITFNYVLGLLRSVPSLTALIVTVTKDSIELSNGVVIEVITASVAAPRGRSYAVVIIEEAAFLPTDQSSNPDVELLRAVRPALARVPGSMLVVVSSPYARKGVLWTAWQKYHDQPDGAVVFVQAPTLTLNPTFDAAAVAQAYEDDPASAAAEYGAEFRADVESFIGPDVLSAVTVPGRFELPPSADHVYKAFVDPAGGSGGDSFTMSISHAEYHHDRLVAVVDCDREVRPPCSPEQTVAEFAALAKTYGIASVTGDRYAGEWPREQFRKHGVEYVVSGRSKSDIYRDVLPMLNSGGVELLDHARLLAQLAGLERRTARGGKDSIDHGPSGHDDVANAVCGALLLAAAGGSGKYTSVTPDLNRPLSDWCPLFY